ncbi:hypothetical protein SAMN05444417_1272 [Wenxinia saemankumensis]|uniref:DUF4157 domain-containing protein n=2 Tax=Wenxinia saemankumensis TaxID=1447782 RepID=A0A1M6CMN3_9RHOB|nr:hypothetical protein SAMN05444417_1272 [Wenxinia saemankumensis]
MAHAFLGPAIRPEAVRFHGDLAAGPSRTVPTRPRETCRERIMPPIEGPSFQSSTAAMAAFDHVWVRPSLFLEDYLAGIEEGVLNLPAAMLFLHEMVHVWQWQNRAVTGYHPLKAAFEHVRSADPYLFDPETRADLLDFGWEQQGVIVEEYLCCRTLAPEAERTSRLHAMLGVHFDLPALSRPIAREALLPWDGVELAGICD